MCTNVDASKVYTEGRAVLVTELGDEESKVVKSVETECAADKSVKQPA